MRVNVELEVVLLEDLVVLSIGQITADINGDGLQLGRSDSHGAEVRGVQVGKLN